MYYYYLILSFATIFLSSSLGYSAVEEVILRSGNIQTRISQINGRMVKRYIGNYEGRDFTLYLSVNPEDYNRISRLPHDDISAMVQHAQNIELQGFPDQIINLATLWSLSKEEIANLVLAIIGAIPYELDIDETGKYEYYRYATETLTDGAGDCEDTTILAAALFQMLGYNIILINPPGHIALGVAGDFGGRGVKYKGINYFYAETTGAGWRVGEVPDNVKLASIKLIEIDQVNVSPRNQNPGQKVVPQSAIPQKKRKTIVKKKKRQQNTNAINQTESNNARANILIYFLIISFWSIIIVIIIYYFRKKSKDNKNATNSSIKSELSLKKVNISNRRKL